MKNQMIILSVVSSLCLGMTSVQAQDTDSEIQAMQTYEVYASPVWSQLKRLRAEMEQKLDNKMTWMNFANESFDLMQKEQAAGTADQASAVTSDLEQQARAE